MATRKVLLKQDISALDPDNFIQNELVDIGVGKDRLLVTEYGAFFTEGVVITDENDVLIDRSLYTFCDLYVEATKASGKEVWNAVVINDFNVPRKLKISYHAYGGKFSANGRLLIEWVNEKLNEAIAPIAWLELINVPREFNPAHHLQLWDEVYGFQYLKKPLEKIENAIRLDSSVFFDMVIRDIKQKLIDAEKQAIETAKFYASSAVTKATTGISRETLNLHLLANLPTAPVTEMRRIAKSDFASSSLIEDKYINKKGLVAFTEALKARSVSIAKTGLGTNKPTILEPIKGNLLAMGNGSIFTIESKAAIVATNNGYEENVYPKNYPDTDRFTVLRVTNNLEDHGGLFLGFNNTTGDMYSGVLKDDACYRRIKWYRFYSDATYDGILTSLNEHVALRNNPHKLTKEQVQLEKVSNLPVITMDQLMGNEPVDAYITLDTLQAFMVKHLLDLKPEFKEDGTLKKDSDLFNKPNLIFTPCDKKVEENFPPQGQLLKTYCDGSDRFQRKADGKGGFTDEVLQLDSDDCNYKEIPTQGTVLYSYCDDKNEKSVIADGRGATTLVITVVNSEKCGFIAPPTAGTVLGEACAATGFALVKKVADGKGGFTEQVVQANSAQCGYIAPTTKAPLTPVITLKSSHRKIEAGTRETFTATFTNFPENSQVFFNMQQREPTGITWGGAFKDWSDALSGDININAQGSGTWTWVQVDDGTTVPRGTGWSNRVVTASGVTSNAIQREFVTAGYSQLA